MSEYQEHFSPDGEHIQYQMENPGQMKDSQDWLVAVTNLYTDYYANKITLGELSDGVNSIVREHFLKEALEMIGEDEKPCTKTWDCPCGSEHSLKEDYSKQNKLRQELRNKFNDKYKED